MLIHGCVEVAERLVQGASRAVMTHNERRATQYKALSGPTRGVAAQIRDCCVAELGQWSPLTGALRLAFTDLCRQRSRESASDRLLRWSLFWTVIAIITWFIFIGMLIAFIVWVWWLYRHIRGLIRLADHLPMPR